MGFVISLNLFPHLENGVVPDLLTKGIGSCGPRRGGCVEGVLPQEDKEGQRPLCSWAGALCSASAPPGQAASVSSLPQHPFLIAGCSLRIPGFWLQAAPGIRVSLCFLRLRWCDPVLAPGCKCRELSGGETLRPHLGPAGLFRQPQPTWPPPASCTPGPLVKQWL